MKHFLFLSFIFVKGLENKLNTDGQFTCKDVIFEDMSLVMKDSINRMKNVDEETCKAYCDADLHNCNSYYHVREDRICVLFRIYFKDLEKLPKILAAPKDCDIKIDKCVRFLIFLRKKT